MIILLQLYDKIEDIKNADQTCVKIELGQCSQAVKDVRDQTHCLKTVLFEMQHRVMWSSVWNSL